MKKNEELKKIFDRCLESSYPSTDIAIERLSNEKLHIYIGLDGTSDRLHLGHASNLMVLEDLRKLGHKVTIVFGDFTGTVGDPTDKNESRNKLSLQKTRENTSKWRNQISKIINLSGFSNPAKIKYNSKWLEKIDLDKFLEYTSMLTAQQLFERDMFKMRIDKEKPIYLNEFLYPVLQGLDSVYLDVDVELCGTDQIFNALVGRTFQKKFKNKDKLVIATGLLQDSDTGLMMSKSEGRGVFLDSTPSDMFGQIMSLTDGIIIPLFTKCTRIPIEKVKEKEEMLRERKVNPRDLKSEVAFEIVKIFHGEEKAVKAKESFVKQFQEHMVADDVKVVVVDEQISIVYAVAAYIDTVDSNGEAKRRLREGAIYLDNVRVTDPTIEIDLSSWGRESIKMWEKSSCS